MSKKKKEEITIHSNVVEYLTYITFINSEENNIEIQYKDSNIQLTSKMITKFYNM